MQDRATQYARDVLAGKIVAGELVKAACKRHLDDIEKSKAAPYRYCFSVEESERILNFAETLTIAEGTEPKKVELYPFQCFILGSLNGWRTKDGNDRRYRTSYIQLGRQNGKSFLNGILASFYGNFDGFRYGQIYCTATKADQAKIVFKEIVKFIRADEDLEQFFVIHEHNATIDCKLTESTIKALSGDIKSIDGFRPYLGIVDEYHAHKTDQMFKLLEGGIKMLPSALISIITTAGFDLKSPCRAEYEYCKQVVIGAVENESRFVYIAQLDEKDDIWKPENWLKANPALEYNPKALENMKPIAIAAKAKGGADLRDFIVKQLNCWIQYTEDVYIKNMDWWIQSESTRTLEDFREMCCYVGLDLSSGGDLTSLAIVIPYLTPESTKKYFVHAHSFIPANRMQEHMQTDRAPYDIWTKNGWITVTETMGGIKTDYKYIIAYLKNIIKEYKLNIQYICYDPHNASAFLNDLEELDCDSLAVVQSARSLGDATEDFRLEIQAGNVEHEKNDSVQWSLANAKVTTNSFGEIKIDKETAGNRIDIIDSIIDAWTQAMSGEAKENAEQQAADWLDFMDKLGI